jgi:hypothetical protein
MIFGKCPRFRLITQPQEPSDCWESEQGLAAIAHEWLDSLDDLLVVDDEALELYFGRYMVGMLSEMGLERDEVAEMRKRKGELIGQEKFFFSQSLAMGVHHPEVSTFSATLPHTYPCLHFSSLQSSCRVCTKTSHP